MAIYKLGDMGNWRKSPKITSNNFVSTNNMNQQDEPKFYSGIGKTYFKNDILMSNIQPNLNKVWIANRSGSCSGDVLILQAKIEIIKSKFLFFIISSKKFNEFWTNSIKGTTIPRGDKKTILNFKIDLLPIIKQQEIIDIIEPKEKLFLDYSSCVRIDKFENTKKDIKSLIDIIEPFEKFLNRTKILRTKIKMLLSLNYKLNDENICNILKFAKLNSKKYLSQNYYFATNSVGELERDFSKKNNITIKKPTRANLTPKNKSILIAKMVGENKIYYNNDNDKFVYSTGFFNLITQYSDHYIGFFLSNFWKKQKENFSNGTTQIAINKSSFSKIQIKNQLLRKIQ